MASVRGAARQRSQMPRSASAVDAGGGLIELPDASMTREAAVVEGSDLQPLLPDAAAAGRRSGGGAAPSSRLMALTAIAGVGGLLFGIDTSVISGAMPYIRDEILVEKYGDDPSRLAWVQGAIVSAAILAAGLSSAVGGLLSDRWGRRRALLAADALFALGAAAMAAARSGGALVAGRALVGLGIGLASVAAPVYIAECAPPGRRASLVATNVLMITGGQLLAYLLNYAATFLPGTWRWMLGLPALPALAQAVGLTTLPESPAWLAGHGRPAEAAVALEELQPGAAAAAAAAPRPAAAEEGGEPVPGGSVGQLLLTRPVLRQLHVGLGLQALQQAAGINTVLYWAPTILELAGFRDKRSALLAALAPAGVNAAGTLVGVALVDRAGRRRLLLSSLVATALALGALGGAFSAAERSSPGAAAAGSSCGAPSCTLCLRAGCGFCGPIDAPLQQGTCLSLGPGGEPAAGACEPAAGMSLYLFGCPSAYTGLVLAGLMLYLAAFSPGLGPVPWAVNAEIYPLPVRGLATGLAATVNWLTNAVVAQSFLPMMRVLGGSGTFWCYAAVAAVGTAWVAAVLPETAGLSLEQVQRLFVRGEPKAAGAELD